MFISERELKEQLKKQNKIARKLISFCNKLIHIIRKYEKVDELEEELLDIIDGD